MIDYGIGRRRRSSARGRVAGRDFCRAIGSLFGARYSSLLYSPRAGIMFKTVGSLAVVLMFAQILCVQRVILDDSYPAAIRSDLQAVAKDVRSIVQDLFQSDPPLDLPIYCRVEPVRPTTRLDDWSHPTRILIGLTATDRAYAQFAYQLGHELGHVMLDPRRTNGLVETICIALSYEILDRLSEKWAVAPPYVHWRSYASEFRKYREDLEQDALSRFPEAIRSSVRRRHWVELGVYLYAHRAEQEQLSQDRIASQRGRDIQSLGAIALRSGHVFWRQMSRLGSCTYPSPAEDPSLMILPLSESCIARQSEMFCRIGRGCPPGP
jgi:hypothetical protein